MSRIFISYSRVDRPFAREFARRLVRIYEHVFYNEGLSGGQVWWEEILNQIATCDVFIYLLSPESVVSEYCQAELTEARRLGKQILPILIRPRTSIPEDLSEIQYVDMCDGITADSVVELERAIVRLRDKMPTVPPQPTSHEPTPAPIVQQPIPPAARGLILLPVIILITGIVCILTTLNALISVPTAVPTIEVSTTEPAAQTQEVATEVSPTTSQTSTTPIPTLTDTPSITPTPATRTSTPSFGTRVAQGELPSDWAILHLFAERDSLTLYIDAGEEQTVLLQELSFRILVNNELSNITFANWFNYFELTNDFASSGDCFVLRLAGAETPLVTDCSAPQVYRREVALADVFWYDLTRNRLQDIAVLRNGQLIRICPAAIPDCVIQWASPPLPPPLPTAIEVFTTATPCSGMMPILGGTYFVAGQTVTVNSFSISQSPISRDEYNSFAASNGLDLLPDRPQQIALDIPQPNAAGYCASQGMHLPSLDELLAGASQGVFDNMPPTEMPFYEEWTQTLVGNSVQVVVWDGSTISVGSRPPDNFPAMLFISFRCAR